MADESRPPDEPKRQPLILEVLIGEDGEVIFPDLNEDLLDVALALDPDSELACRRPQQKAGTDEGGSDS